MKCDTERSAIAAALRKQGKIRRIHDNHNTASCAGAAVIHVASRTELATTGDDQQQRAHYGPKSNSMGWMGLPIESAVNKSCQTIFLISCTMWSGDAPSMDLNTHTHTRSQRNQMKINVWHSILQQNMCTTMGSASARAQGHNRRACLNFAQRWMGALHPFRISIRWHWHCSVCDIYRTNVGCRNRSDSRLMLRECEDKIDERTKVICKLIFAARSMIYYFAPDCRPFKRMITKSTNIAIYFPQFFYVSSI